MLQIPLNKVNFRRDFLNGAGQLALELDGGGGAFALDKPFASTVKNLVAVNTAVNPPSFEFGKTGGLTCKVTFQGSARSGVELIWPEQASEFAKQHELMDLISAGKVGARLYFAGQAGASAAGSMPLGPANFEFGVKAGAGVGYDRFCVYDAATASATLLRDLVTGLRLPQHCDQLDRIPDEGELVAFRYQGFLELAAGLSWGYELTGSHGIDFQDLHAAVQYALRLKAGVTFGYRLAGEFDVEARRGEKPGWVRVKVRKKRDSKFDFAAAFKADGDVKLTGLPDSADEFLIALFGADARSALDIFAKARTYTDLKELEKLTGKLLKRNVHNLSQKWIGKALDQSNVQEFLAVVNRVVTEYESAEKTVVDRAVHLYEDYLGEGKLDVLEKALQRIASLNSREGLKNLSDAEAWKVIDRLVGGAMFRLMRENAVFAEVTGTAEKALAFLQGSWQARLRDVVSELKTSFQLDKLFGELAKYASKERLLALADETLQGLAERLLGRVWAEINTSNVAAVAKELNDTLKRIDQFKNTWYKKLTEAANQSFALQANYAYSRASRNQALIDVEIDVSTPAGQQLFQAAAHGHFRALLAKDNLAILEVHEGVLTHELTKSAQLHISVFGWEYKRLVEVMSSTENAIVTQANGLIQVFTTQAAIKQRSEKKGRDKMTETIESNFLMKFLGEAFRPPELETEESRGDKNFLVKSINRMAVEYDLFYADDLTNLSELSEYLKLGVTLGLIPSAGHLAQELAEQFPGGLGKVTARYVVSYDDGGIRDAFTHLSGDPLEELVRQTSRRLIAAQFLQRRHTDWLARIGFAYMDPAVQQLYDQEGYPAVLARVQEVKLPAWFTGGEEQRVELRSEFRHILVTLLGMERTLAERLSKLDEVIDEARKKKKPVSEDELEKAARQFVEQAADIDKFGRVNTFFAVFDNFIKAGSNGKGYRDSSMILEVRADDAAKKVTKFFMAGPAGASQLGEPVDAVAVAGRAF